jgi:hypothetical protein
MSTLSGGPNIVYDDLVLYLDAANTKSYVSGSTTWTDISKTGNNGTLTNGSTFNTGSGGSIVFDGSDDSVVSTNTINITGSAARTINIWFRSTGTISTRQALAYFGSEAANGRSYIEIESSQFKFNTGAVALGGAVVANVWYNGAVTFSGSILTVYINGIQVNTSTPTLNTGTGNLILGRFVTNIFPLTGNIAQYSLYNRALSATEILQNYNATKGRFGL